MSLVEQSRNRLAVKQHLRKMELFEKKAFRWEQSEGETLRRTLASYYRRVIGVTPDQRDAFRSTLEKAVEHGNLSIGQLLEQFRTRYQNSGLSGSEASEVDSF